MALLKKGLRGEPVRRLQAKLGIPADGIFGPATDSAVRAYQTENGLKVDGIAGPDTFFRMGLFELVQLKKGTHGTTVQRLQEALNIGADGIFGSGTEAAVKRFQAEKGLQVDGIAGPETLAGLELSFQEFTKEVIEAAQIPLNYQDPIVPPDMELDAEAKVAAAEANVAAAQAETTEQKKGIWGTVKGWFS